MNELVLALAIMGAPESDPPLSDLQRFPQYDVCRGNLEVGWAHCKWLGFQAIINVWQQDDYWQWKVEAAFAVDAWQKLSYARNEKMPQQARRQQLGELRDHVGQTAYDQGWMPLPVPFRFYSEGR